MQDPDTAIKEPTSQLVFSGIEARRLCFTNTSLDSLCGSQHLQLVIGLRSSEQGWLKRSLTDRGRCWFVFSSLILFILGCTAACGILVPDPGLNSHPLRVEVQSLSL